MTQCRMLPSGNSRTAALSSAGEEDCGLVWEVMHVKQWWSATVHLSKQMFKKKSTGVFYRNRKCGVSRLNCIFYQSWSQQLWICGGYFHRPGCVSFFSATTHMAVFQIWTKGGKTWKMSFSSGSVCTHTRVNACVKEKETESHMTWHVNLLNWWFPAGKLTTKGAALYWTMCVYWCHRELRDMMFTNWAFPMWQWGKEWVCYEEITYLALFCIIYSLLIQIKCILAENQTNCNSRSPHYNHVSIGKYCGWSFCFESTGSSQCYLSVHKTYIDM